MIMIIDDKVEVMVREDDKVIESKNLVVDEKTFEKPLVDEHDTKARKGEDKEVSKILTLIPRLSSPSLQRLKKND